MEIELIEEVVETATVSRTGLVLAAGVITVGAVLATTLLVRKKLAARREAKNLASVENDFVEIYEEEVE